MPHRHNQIEINELDDKAKKGVKTRVLVALPLIAVAAIALIFGSWAIFAILAICLGFSVYEIMRSPGKRFNFWTWIATYVFGFGLAFWPLLKSNVAAFIESVSGGPAYHFMLEEAFAQPIIPITLVGLMVIVYFLMGILDRDLSFRDISYLFLLTLIVGFAYQSLLFCRYYPSVSFFEDTTYGWQGHYGSDLLALPHFRFGWGSALLVTVVLVSALTDTFAFFGGLLFGKHKMNPRVSPKKTWEGFFFGIGGGTLVALSVMFALAASGYPLLPELDMAHWYRMLILGILLPFFATIGDFAFSLIKRGEGIKDFGVAFPGHGGFLDRLDSHLISALGTATILAFFMHGWLF